jgi:outer membrane protein assembly factor BamA
MSYVRLLAWLLVGLAPLAAGAQDRLPSFEELEAEGAVIGEIDVVTHDIFDLADPRENKYLYRFANRLHITTRPWLIRRMLLFKTGDPVSRRIIEETERLIRGNAKVYDVAIEPTRYENGVVDLRVRTRDTWTLDPNVHVSRAGGVNTGGYSLKEGNLAGTGTTIEVERTKDIDRTGSHFKLSHEHLFDGWTKLSIDRASLSDGSSLALEANRPFYSLDTRWAAGSSFSRFDRTDSLYQNGNVVGEYRHMARAYGAYAGWSAGRVGRWTSRYRVGANYNEDTYTPSATVPPPVPIPTDRTLAGPYVAYELLEEDYLLLQNRERIQRPEYFSMGWASSLQIGRSLAAFGATEQPWQLGASVSKGFRLPEDGQLLASTSYSGQYGSTTGDVRSLGASLRYYRPQGRHLLFFFGGNATTLKVASAANELSLGGDSGVRGYPARYQAGTRSAVFTFEERYYTDWYPFNLFRVGWAVYYDLGRAWGGELPNRTPGWLSNVGFGLRILNARASFGNVLHVDLAFPLHRSDPTIDARQFVVQTGATF